MCRAGKKVAVCRAEHTLVYTLDSHGGVQIETVPREKIKGVEYSFVWFSETQPIREVK